MSATNGAYSKESFERARHRVAVLTPELNKLYEKQPTLDEFEDWFIRTHGLQQLVKRYKRYIQLHRSQYNYEQALADRGRDETDATTA